MERKLQERMVGAGVLILALVLFGPMILDGGSSRQAEESLPPGQRGDELRTHTFRLDQPGPAPPQTQAPAAVPVAPVVQDGSPAAPAVAATETVSSPVARVSEPAAGEQEPDVASAAASSRQPASERVTPPASATSGSQRWVVQIGTFGQKPNADRLSARLKDAGFEAFVSPMSRGEQTLYRVQVGPPGTRDEISGLAKRLAAAGHQGQIVSR